MSIEKIDDKTFYNVIQTKTQYGVDEIHSQMDLLDQKKAELQALLDSAMQAGVNTIKP